MIEPFPPLVALRKLQAFFLPETLNLLVVHPPAFDPQKLRNLAVSVTAILFCQTDHGKPQCVVIFRNGFVLHRTARKAYDLARATLWGI